MTAEQLLEVRRSARRTRTVTVLRERGQLVALVPERLTRAQEAELLPPLVERFLRREARAGSRLGDEELLERARHLHRQFLQPQVDTPLPPVQLHWVDNQFRRWGSCNCATGEIRLSARLRTMPAWVLDYVLVHELAHLRQPDHSAAFHRLVAAYPRHGEARAFLHGYQHAVDVAASGSGDRVDDGDLLD